ncbi:hypothetical protein SeLEV6574_g05926 [Synchytrium endobioticum]|uniref:Uncharacterized protein n=1 Tax=Synchytrium endobioticum TaxID=286115 RepID=A0A507CRK4_9FUNG|nr:hypothetical protein SeLEV6574_g05926 [Synchytrium endobioticum]
MATTTACSIKATAVMCLLWMVFLSASAAGKLEENKHAQQLAFNNIGTYGDGDELLANKNKLYAFRWHGRFMIAKFQTIYENLESKLGKGDFLVDEDLELWKDLRILVTTEKFPWSHGRFPAINRFPCLNHRKHRMEYYMYLKFFEKCVNPFQKRMENVALKLEKAYTNLEPKFASGASLGDEPDMKTILTIISIEEHIWGENQMKWAQPLSYTGNVIFLRYRDIRSRCSQLIHTQDQKYGGYKTHLHESPMDTARQGTTNHGDLYSVVSGGVAEPIASNQQWPLFTSDGYAGTSHGSTYTDRSEFGYNGIEGTTSFAHESPMDTARQGTTNHGDLDSVVSGGVAKPIASNQQWPLFTSDGYAGTSHGSTYTDRSEFGYIPGFNLGQPDDTTTMRPYADLSGYGISTEYYHAYTGDDSSIEGTTSFAHPPTYAPAGPSEYGSPHPPSGSRRLKRRSARFRS